MRKHALNMCVGGGVDAGVRSSTGLLTFHLDRVVYDRTERETQRRTERELLMIQN